SIAPIQIQAAGADLPAAEVPRAKVVEQGPTWDAVPTAPQAANDDDGNLAPAVEWPVAVRGTIKDADGKPIAGARVRFDFEKIHEYNIGRWDENLNSQSLVTGEDGVYRFDTSQFPKLTHRPFCLTLTCMADGYADTKWWNWYGRNDRSVKEVLTNIKLLPGRL